MKNSRLFTRGVGEGRAVFRDPVHLLEKTAPGRIPERQVHRRRARLFLGVGIIEIGERLWIESESGGEDGAVSLLVRRGRGIALRRARLDAALPAGAVAFRIVGRRSLRDKGEAIGAAMRLKKRG